VTAEGTFTPDSDIDRVFGPVVHAQTYRHLAWALLAFPLGLIYFITTIVGISVGFGLMIVAVGFVILALTLAVARVFATLEREMAKALLGATFEPRPPFPRGWRAMLRDRRTWRMVIYMILRLPLGLAGFASSVLMLASVPAMAAPLAYTVLPYWVNGYPVATWEEAMLVALFGAVFFLVSAHLVNGVAAMARKLAIALL